MCDAQSGCAYRLHRCHSTIGTHIRGQAHGIETRVAEYSCSTSIQTSSEYLVTESTMIAPSTKILATIGRPNAKVRVATRAELVSPLYSPIAMIVTWATPACRICALAMRYPVSVGSMIAGSAVESRLAEQSLPEDQQMAIRMKVDKLKANLMFGFVGDYFKRALARLYVPLCPISKFVVFLGF